MTRSLQSKRTIFLVEDDLLIMRMYQRKFAKMGFEVETALDGAEALEIIKKGFAPDLILLDIMMPKLNGFEFLEALKKLEKNIPVIILTNLIDTEEAKARGKALGAKDYIVKSETSMEEVAKKVEKALSKPR